MRFSILAKQISVLSLVLGFVLALCYVQIIMCTGWSSLFNDRNGAQIQEIVTASVVNEFPVSNATLQKILAGGYVAGTIPIKIVNDWKSHTSDDGSVFRIQLAAALGSNYPRGSVSHGLQGTKYAVFSDIPAALLKAVDRPTLFFFKFNGNWDVFANGKYLTSGDGDDNYFAIRIPKEMARSDVRITWLIENTKKETILGPNFRHGISLRSAVEASIAKRNLPVNIEIPHFLSFWTYIIFSVMAIIFAISMRQYTDLWAFATFMGTMAAAVWAETPMYFYSFQWIGQRSDDFIFARGLIHGTVVLTSIALTISFFRVRGLISWTTLSVALFASVIVLACQIPYGNLEDATTIRNTTGVGLVLILLPGQTFAFFFGWRSLLRDYRRLKTDGLLGYLPALRRRFVESALFTVGMLVMLGFYSLSMPLQALSSGPDLFLMGALIPATVLFIQIYWMMGASARLRERLMPQLNYADFLCLFLYELAVEGLYHGALFVGDLRGFKKITGLKKKSPQHKAAVRDLLKAVHRDLMAFVEKDGRVVFRFKKNGDEWIWAFFAKDEQQSVEIYCELMSSWAKASGPLIKSWKDLLTRSLGSALTTDDAEVVENLGMHLMSCPLRGMRLDADDDMSRPDFEADEFTTLSAIFKITAHQSVGSIESDAKLLIERHPELGFKCREPSVSEWKAAGVAEPPAGVVLLEWTGHLQVASDDQDVGPGQDASSLPSAS